MNGYTLRDVLSLVDGLIVREECEDGGSEKENEKNEESETNKANGNGSDIENEERENEVKEDETENEGDRGYGTKSLNGEIRINETNATILGLALGSTFTTAMELVGNQAVAVVLFATGEITATANSATLTAKSSANSANLSLTAAAYLAHLETDYTNNRYPICVGVPALTVNYKHCTHVVDLTAWYCTCYTPYCAHLVAAAIAVRNRLVSARHRTCPSLPLGPITGALNDILFS